MSRRDISELYFPNRFLPMSTMKFVFFLPLGIMLSIIRLFLGLQVFILGCLIPDICLFAALQRLLCNLLIAMLGISVNTENSKNREDVEAYVSNYVTPYDSLIMHYLTDSVKPGKELFNSVISLALGIRSFGAIENFGNFKKNVESTIAGKKHPLFFQPECKQTNGTAILGFKTWPFQLCSTVQPIAIQVSRPLWGVKVSSFNSKRWVDTVWYFLSPCTNYTVRFLPVVERNNMSPADFAERIRQDIANSLNVELSDYSSSDLLEWEKRVVHSLERMGILGTQLLQLPRSTKPTSVNPEIDRMTRQVQDVFPLIPYKAIYTDLLSTRNTDQTITNILDGRVTYTTETTSSNSTSSTSEAEASTSETTTKQDSPVKVVTAFGKTAKERMFTFKERKQQLIENARKRYIETHGLNIVGSS